MNRRGCFWEWESDAGGTTPRGGEGRSLNLLGLALQNTQGVEAAGACWQEALHILAELGLPPVGDTPAQILDTIFFVEGARS